MYSDVVSIVARPDVVPALLLQCGAHNNFLFLVFRLLLGGLIPSCKSLLRPTVVREVSCFHIPSDLPSKEDSDDDDGIEQRRQTGERITATAVQLRLNHYYYCCVVTHCCVGRVDIGCKSEPNRS